MPPEDVWLSGVYGGKSVSLECITGQSDRSRADFRLYQASFEDLLLLVILDVSHVQRIGEFLVMRYINVRFTYLLYCSDTDTWWTTANLSLTPVCQLSRQLRSAVVVSRTRRPTCSSLGDTFAASVPRIWNSGQSVA